MADEAKDGFLPLAEVIQGLRTEILKAAAVAGNEAIRFGVGPIDLEFQVVAKKEGGANGTIKFGIWGVGLEVGGNVKVASEQTQKVKFTLKPIHVAADGNRTDVEIFRSTTG